MLVDQLKKKFENTLEKEYPIGEIHSFFYMLTQDFLGLSRLDLALNRSAEIDKRNIPKFENALLKLKEHHPIQYIIGKTVFFEMEFKVDNNVLIPRPETEELVQWIIDEYQNSQTPVTILDIGTGSGCIAISLAKHIKNSKVSALDISPEALKIAKANAIKNAVEINFLEKDILELENLDQDFDIIVSNPPYVRVLEKKEMHQNVLNYEPDLALYVEDNDPLIFYKKISNLANKSLKKNGSLYFEINQYLGKETKSALKKEGFTSIIKTDIFGNERMLKANLK